MPEQDMHPYVQLLWNTITIEFMIKFAIVYFFIVWIALVIWVAKDISSRSNSLIFQFVCILLMILFTPLGVFLYLIIRPGESMYEKYTQEIEENLGILSEIVHDRLGDIETEESLCPHCDKTIELDFVVCPHCHESLKHTCVSCCKEIREGWDICPYCGSKQDKKHGKKKKKKEDIT